MVSSYRIAGYALVKESYDLRERVISLETFLIIILTIVMLVPLMAFLNWKYIKCPYCGGKIEPYNVFQCPHCLNALNEEFLVSLQE